MARVILHADLNNFYASVACLNRPALREVPVAVCGDPALRHGIVLAKNMVAKRQGVTTGQAIWQAKQLCPELVTIAPDFDRVLSLSEQVHGIFTRYTGRVQSFGVDEAWLDLSEPSMTLFRGERIANHLRHTVREETGLTVSVGVSDNRVFAKLGSDLKKPDAVSVISPENRACVLDPLPVSDLLFVGRATSRKLNLVGIYTVGQLARTDPNVLKGLLGKNGLMLSAFARGEDLSPVAFSHMEPTLKSVGNSSTTPRDMQTWCDARITLYGLCESVASRMRKHSLLGRVVRLWIRDTELESIQRQCVLDAPTDCSYDLFNAAYGLLRNNWAQEKPLRSLGVSMTRLILARDAVQLSFLPDEALRQKQAALDRVVDKIRDRYGHFAIQRAIMLVDETLGSSNPEEEHVIHPEPYFK